MEPISGQMAIEAFEQGEAQAMRAAVWARDNWPSFCAVMRFLESEAAAGNPRLTRSDVLAECRRGRVEMTDDGSFKRDHNLYPAIVRYMAMMRPAVRKVLSFRGSKCDEVDMAAIWDEINPNSQLAVRDWRSA